MSSPKNPTLILVATAFCLLTGAQPLFSADAPATSAPAPAPAAASAEAPAQPAPGAAQAPAGGGRRGGGGRGTPMTPEDQAKIAKLSELPPWKPGVGEGDYRMVPNTTNTPPFSDTNPAYAPAPENAPRANVPKGRVELFHLPLAGSKFFPPGGGRGGGAAPAAPTASATVAGGAPFSREDLHQKKGMGNNTVERNVYVYIPAGYVAGTPAPLLFCHDAMGMHDTLPAPFLPDILDNMIADKRLPPMIAVMVDPSNQRSLEYDTVSAKFADYVEAEILPVVEQKYNVKFTKDPDARAVIGGSSGAAAAMSMAWFRTELYHRVLMYSPTFITFQTDPEIAPRGAVEYYENFIPNQPKKPLRIWLQVGDRDNGSTGSDAGRRNWVFAAMHAAAALKAKGYPYQFVFSPQAGHVDRPVRSATLAPALEWLWKDYKPATK